MPKVNYAKLYTLRADGRYQGYYRDADGKRHAVCDRDPEKLYRKLQAAALPRAATLAALIDGWDAEYVTTLSYKTRESYAAPIRRIKEALGDFAAKDVTVRQLGAFLERLHAQGFEKRSIRLHLTVLKSAYRWGIINEKTDADPTLYVKIPKGLKAETRKPPEDAALEAIRASVGVPFCEYAALIVL